MHSDDDLIRPQGVEGTAIGQRCRRSSAIFHGQALRGSGNTHRQKKTEK
jgi:hypothetical protein